MAFLMQMGKILSRIMAFMAFVFFFLISATHVFAIGTQVPLFYNSVDDSVSMSPSDCVGIQTGSLFKSGFDAPTQDVFTTTQQSGPNAEGDGAGCKSYVGVAGAMDGVHYIVASASSTSPYWIKYWGSFTVNSGVVSGVIDNSVPTTTGIIDFTPHNHATTTNPVHFSLTAYVAPADVGNFIGIKFSLHNIDQNVFLFGGFSPSDIYLLDGFRATSSGYFYFSTSTYVGEGNYMLEADLERTYLGGFIVNPYAPVSQHFEHLFIVGSPTFIGNLTQNVFDDLVTDLASSTATTTKASLASCNPLGNFDTETCVTSLFTPGPKLANTVRDVRETILVRVPWGYLTRVYNIWNSSSTEALPSFDVHLRTGENSSSTISFDPGDMIAGGGTLLESIKDPRYGKSTRDIFQPFVQLSIALAVVFTIIADLMSSHKHANENMGRENKKLS